MNTKWEREKIFQYDCTCEEPLYASPGSSYNSTLHDLAWFQEEAKKNVIIENQRYESSITWASQTEYFCTYKKQAKSGVVGSFPATISTLEQCLENCGVLVGEGLGLYRFFYYFLALIHLWNPIQGCAKEQTPYTPNIYYFSWFLCLGTLCLSFFFKRMFTSPFGPSWLRKIFFDFAVIFAIVIMVGVDIGVGLKVFKLEKFMKFEFIRIRRNSTFQVHSHQLDQIEAGGSTLSSTTNHGQLAWQSPSLY